mmetsp:Transcript_50294/g.132827  ORF Transcript_50294/g.132827 Transcript_50294/m.132827 type:complete len:822 (+) Transcript_50294:738-3203(+)
MQAYLRGRATAVKARSFDLTKLKEGVVPTGRTIRPMAAWKDLWAPLREFLQNTIDHLSLFKDGALHPALTLTRTAGGAGGAPLLTFACGDTRVCTIEAVADELTITQWFTYPLHPRALDTGVADTTKGGEGTAGGFGDGFKTAVVACLALPGGACRAIEWEMVGGGRRITWDFRAAKREAVGTFSSATVLEVDIRSEAARAAAGDNIFRQRLAVRGIGAAFLRLGMARLQLFHTIDEAVALTTRRGDVLCRAADQPPLLGGDGASRPEPGVYVRGIWVRSPPIEGALMAFVGKLDVSGRDRNDVDAEELMDATAQLMHTSVHQSDGHMGLLRTLLAPLRTPSSAPTWLTRAPRFLNRLLEAYNEFFVRDVFEVPPGALFVSKRTTDSKEPFIKWACGYLFREVSEAELEERCVAELLRHVAEVDAEPLAKPLRASIGKLLQFVGLGPRHFKVHFSSAVGVAFVHGQQAFVPVQPLTRGLLLRVMGAVQAKLPDTRHSDGFQHAMQGLFEALPGAADRPVTEADVDSAVEAAKRVRVEAKAFLAWNPAANGGGTSGKGKDGGGADAAGSKRGAKGKGGASSSEPLDVEDDAADGDGAAAGGRAGGKNRNGDNSGGGRSVNGRAALEQSIRSLGRAGGRAEAVLPSSAFAEDGPDDTKECLRPHSTLRLVDACDAAGGGRVYCDTGSVGVLGGQASAAELQRLRDVRRVIADAKALIAAALPSLAPTLRDVVFDAYDGSNAGYDGACMPQAIVVNVMPVLRRLPPHPAPLPADLVHEFVMTVTHECAHMLERGGGHGVAWRDTHANLLQAVYARACAGASAGS